MPFTIFILSNQRQRKVAQAVAKQDVSASTDVRDFISAIEARMIELHPEQTPLPVRHFFAPGIYCRELFIPAGMRLTGMIHKTEHVSIMLSGKMLVFKDNEFVEVNGPMTEVAPAGIKRMGVCIEDTTWITVHPTTETDIDKLEAMLVTEDYAEVEHILDQQDYLKFEQEFGITEEHRSVLRDVPYLPDPSELVQLGPSKRHETGVFASTDFVSGEKLFDVVHKSAGDHLAFLPIGAKFETEWARYTNHSPRPNARMDGYTFYALRDIEKDEEITVNYRHILKGIK